MKALHRLMVTSNAYRLASSTDPANTIDREIDRHFTVLQTLAALPSLASEDWPNFYTQAKAALNGKVYVLVIDSSLRRVVTMPPSPEVIALTG